MAEKENFKIDERWAKIDNEIIYRIKAINSGSFNKGKYYDFYQKKEVDVAEKMLKETCSDIIEKISVLNIEHEITDLWRLTIIFK